MKYLKILLVFVPVSVAAELLKLNESLVFILVCLSIVPLAAVIGSATEQVAIYTGPKLGGLINATMSNIPELLIGFFSVKAGLYSLMLASMAGAMIGNILLVLGLSIFLGGLKHHNQFFNKNAARSNFILLFFAAITNIIPFTLQYAIQSRGSSNSHNAVVAISFSVSIALLVTYISGLIFSLVTHKYIFINHDDNDVQNEIPKWSLKFSICLLVFAALFVGIESEMLVGSVEHIVNNYGFSEVFIGIIIIPILGNVAENVSAILMAVKNKVDICVEIAIGSSIQIALFVAPVLVLLSFLIGNPITYIYDILELVTVLVSIGLSLYIFQDGKTNWFEGIVLLCFYFIVGAAFFYI